MTIQEARKTGSEVPDGQKVYADSRFSEVTAVEVDRGVAAVKCARFMDWTMNARDEDVVAHNFHDRVNAACWDSLAAQFVELHRPHMYHGHSVCWGCDREQHESSLGGPAWPCRSYKLVASTMLNIRDVDAALRQLLRQEREAVGREGEVDRAEGVLLGTASREHSRGKVKLSVMQLELLRYFAGECRNPCPELPVQFRISTLTSLAARGLLECDSLSSRYRISERGERVLDLLDGDEILRGEADPVG